MAASDLPYRCNMFPLKVVFPPDREYARSVDVAEFGDAAGLRAALAAIVRDGYHDRAARARRQTYLDRLSRLAHPARILEQIIGRPQAAGTVAG
jgi:hypothetical protein